MNTADDAKPQVLLMEDDHGLRGLMRRLLLSWKFSLDEVTSVTEGRTLLNAGKTYDLAICDYRLEDGTGVEFAQWAATKAPSLPILLISGFQPTDRRGCQGYLQKPFTAEALREAIDQLLSISRT